jgi:hypothetical protein
MSGEIAKALFTLLALSLPIARARHQADYL